jgi:DNA-binding NarL/FixJ family response regulator
VGLELSGAYISKGAPAEELIEAVKIVAAGGRYLEREIAMELALHPGEHRELSFCDFLPLVRASAQ